MITKSNLQMAVTALEELRSDSTVPKNIKSKIDTIITSLSQDKELSMKINEALNDLDDISDNNNIQPYTRTQIWNVVSLLESV
jgi:uncharacterized protein (UPF0147 family)